ncbi:MAG: thiamine phosphate synthase [Lunatimonas sp.]|uniref:thiamine phosphate synthase n=1 Tax=Lunatimonas sp. TaxID=2060141 RepID=UPI00263A5FDC|nr:thiamine phosphate synthase [Lunatimonas sp.]MCC5938297.1 thiamine phosphate synthase [Lunatimonas sp.]
MKKKIGKGVYLVIDPSMQQEVLLTKLWEISKYPLAAVQVWDNFPLGEDPKDLITQIAKIFHPTHVPLLINNRWELLDSSPLDGVHFDTVPSGFGALKEGWGKDVIIGITCTNDLSRVEWANANGLDYLSFCSMFPSSSAGVCELVSPATVKAAQKMTSLPIYLAGGIKPDKISELIGLDYAGVAVISGIMSSERPGDALNAFYNKL